MEQIKSYVAPTVEVVELVIENAILSASGENSVLDFGE